MGDSLARLGHDLAHAKTGNAALLRGQNMVFRKSRFGWVWLHTEISVISGQKFVGFLSPNVGRIAVDDVVVRFYFFEYRLLFRRRLPLNSKVVRNRAKFCMFLALNFLGRPPKFWTGIIKSNTLPITVQNFAAIGRRSTISRGGKINASKICPLRKLLLPGWLIISLFYGVGGK